MRRIILLVLLALVFTGLRAEAATAPDWEDSDNDGRKETQVLYAENDKSIITKKVSDMNGDGRPDRTVDYKDGKPSTGEADANLDGKIDSWMRYDKGGKLAHAAKDTDGDGQPDQYRQMLKGRNLVLKTYDRNQDRRADKRSLLLWKEDKSIPVYDGSKMEKISVPGYVALWTEEDNNFDGKIDAYREKGDDAPSKKKIGQPIDIKL